MPNKCFKSMPIFLFLLIGFALPPLRLFAAPVEIPFVPFEVSTFPVSLKKLCNDPVDYGIQALCLKLQTGEGDITPVEFKALEYAWKNENSLADKNNEKHEKSKSVLKGIIDGATAVKGAGSTFNNADEQKRGRPSIPSFITTEKFSSLEEKFINGLAEFVVTRAKAEAAFFFQEKLKKELCDKEENKEYFPNTCVALDTLQLSMSLNSMGGYLRAAIKKDIENLPYVFLKDAIFESYNNENKDLAEALVTTRLLIGAYAAAREGMTPNDILRGLSGIDETLKCDGNDLTQKKCTKGGFNSKVIKTLHDISKLYKAYETNIYYFDKDVLKIRPADERPYVTVGLIFTYYEDILQGKEDSMLKQLNSLLKTNSILRQVQEMQDLVAMIKQPVVTDDSKKYDPKQRLYERIQAMDKMLTLIAALYEQAKKLEIITGQNHDNIMANLRKYASIANNILRGDEAGYMQAFLILISDTSKQLPLFAKSEFQNYSVYELNEQIDLLVRKESKEPDKLAWLNAVLKDENSCKLMSNANNTQCKVTGYALIKLNRQLIESQYSRWTPKLKDKSILGDEIKRVIPVMVEIANAETSKDVANILETAAAPVGSYREKAKRDMFSVTALFGAGFAGRERYTLDGNKKSHRLELQAFAPVGFEYSWSISPTGYIAKNVGVFLSVVDLGPLVSTKTESGVKSDTSVGFRQLFSPGAYVKVHLYGPFNIGYGISKTPDVMKSETTGNEITNAWRHQAFIAIDLTLFPF